MELWQIDVMGGVRLPDCSEVKVPTVLTSSLPRTETRQRRGRDEVETRFLLAQWTGTASSSPASASGTTIGFGRR